MSDVVQFERPTPPPPPEAQTLKDWFGDDDWALQMCARWRMERAQQQRIWAEADLKFGWGFLVAPGFDIDTAPLDRMHWLQEQLSIVEPRTMLLACELLRLCATILAYEKVDSESTLAHGPVLEIVRNVLNALEHVSGTVPVGETVQRRRKRRPRTEPAAAA